MSESKGPSHGQFQIPPKEQAIARATGQLMEARSVLADAKIPPSDERVIGVALLIAINEASFRAKQ